MGTDISVIIPVRNEAEHIRALIGYLQEHGKGTLKEILVVDGKSQDGTVSIAQAAGATVLHSAVQSRAAQMNLGALAAQGDVLYFVHADTLPPQSFVADIQTALSSGYEMGCFRYRFDSPALLLKLNAYFNRFPWLWCQGGDKTFFIKKEVFRRFGGYNEYYVVMEEYDFLRRAMVHLPLCTIPKYAIVSARKYERNSWLRVQLANILVFNLFRLGVVPERLKWIYKQIIRP